MASRAPTASHGTSRRQSFEVLPDGVGPLDHVLRPDQEGHNLQQVNHNHQNQWCKSYFVPGTANQPINKNKQEDKQPFQSFQAGSTIDHGLIDDLM